MTEEEYVELRLDDQIGWYDKKSGAAQKMFKRLRGWEIVVAASIPVLASLNGLLYIGPIDNSMMMGFLGAAVVILSSLLGLGHYQENWAQYRTTCESLRHERFRYLTKTEPYGGAGAFPLLVERVENLISKENSEWSQAVRSAEQLSTPASE